MLQHLPFKPGQNFPVRHVIVDEVNRCQADASLRQNDFDIGHQLNHYFFADLIVTQLRHVADRIFGDNLPADCRRKL